MNLFKMKWNIAFSYFLRIGFIFYIFAVVFRLRIPFVSDMKSNFVVLVILGAVVSIPSIVQFILGENLLKLSNILGSLIGIMAVVVIVYGFEQKKLVFIDDFNSAFYVLSVLLLLKIAIRIFQENPKKENI